MQVSIVIPVWNGALDIEDCLTSVFEHSGEGVLEVICVDNASEDDSAERIVRGFPRVRLLRQPTNLGFAGGVNVGTDAAAGDLIVLLNQDCIVRQGWLDHLMDAFAQDPEVGVAGVTVLNDDGSVNHAGAEIVRPEGHSRHLTEIRSQNPYPVDYVTGAAFAFRRSVWETVGRFDEGYYPAYYEEADFCYRVRHKGFDVVYVPASSVTHLFSRGEEVLRHPFRLAASQQKMRYRFICKHFNHDQLQAFFAVEVESLVKGNYLNEVYGRLMAARATLGSLNDILARRYLDLDENPDVELQLLARRGFAKIAQEALVATSHQTQPQFQQWVSLQDRIESLRVHEYDLLRRIYFRAPTERTPESSFRRLVRLLILRPLSFLIGRDYLLLSELNTYHVSRLDACQALIVAQSDMVNHILKLNDLFIRYEDL